MSFIRTTHSKGKKYKQLVESKWDSKKKQSRIHVIKHLGQVIEVNGAEKLKPSPLKIDSVDKAYPVGKLAIFWKIAEEFRIQKCLQDALGDDKTSLAILMLVLNQLIGRKSLTKIGKWISETPLPRWTAIETEKLTKDYFLSSLDMISGESENLKLSHSYKIQNNLTNAWRKIIGNEPEKFLFFQDVTRIKWNGGRTYYAEKGHGMQNGRYHIGFGLIVSKDNYMPVMGYPVRGSHHDTSTINETIDNFSRWDMKDITLVWDRGFVSKQNIKSARDNDIHVLSAGVRSDGGVVDWITKYQDSEIEQWENILRMAKGKGIYCNEEIGNLYGQECRIVVTLDPSKRNHSRVERDLLLQTLKLEKSKEAIAKLKKDMGPIILSSRGRRGYKLDKNKEELARKCDGRSLFFSTDIKMDGKEIVKTYFQKDYIEKAFRFLRGDACLSPVKYQLPGRVEAYLSVVDFISYELIAAVLWKINKYKLGVSYNELLDEASKIYEIEFTSKNSKIFRWTHVTKNIEKMFKPFHILDLKT